MATSRDAIINLWNRAGLSRQVRDLEADLADAVLVAEFVHHYVPSLVNLADYVIPTSAPNSPRSAAAATATTTAADVAAGIGAGRKYLNWLTLNRSVFRRLGFDLGDARISAVARGDPDQVHAVCEKVVREIEQYLARERERERDTEQRSAVAPSTASLSSSSLPSYNDVSYQPSSNAAVPPLSLPTSDHAYDNGYTSSHPNNSGNGVGSSSGGGDRVSMDQRLQLYDRELLLKHAAMIDTFEEEVHVYRDRVLADEARKRQVELQNASLDATQMAKLENVHRLEMMELRDLLDKEYMKQKASLKERLADSRRTKLAELRAALVEETRVELQSKAVSARYSPSRSSSARVLSSSSSHGHDSSRRTLAVPSQQASLSASGDPLSQPFPVSPRIDHARTSNNSNIGSSNSRIHDAYHNTNVPSSSGSSSSAAFPSYQQLSRTSSSPYIPSQLSRSMVSSSGALSSRSATNLVTLDDTQQRKSKRIMASAMRIFQETVDVLDGKAKSVESLYAAFADVLSQSQRNGGSSSRRAQRGGRPYIPESHIPASSNRRRSAIASSTPLFYTPDTNVNPHDLYDERSPLYRTPVIPITNHLSSSSSSRHSSSHKKSSGMPRSNISSAPRIVDVSQYVPAATLAAIASGDTTKRRDRRRAINHHYRPSISQSQSRGARGRSRERPAWNRDVNPANPDQYGQPAGITPLKTAKRERLMASVERDNNDRQMNDNDNMNIIDNDRVASLPLWRPSDYPTASVQHLIDHHHHHHGNPTSDRDSLRASYDASAAAVATAVPLSSNVGVSSSPQLAAYPSTPLPSSFPSTHASTTAAAIPSSSSSSAASGVPSIAQQRSLAELTNQFRDLVHSMDTLA